MILLHPIYSLKIVSCEGASSYFCEDKELNQQFEKVAAEQLRKNDLVLISAGEVIPADGEILEGIATVDESAITGESAPVIREAGGDRDGGAGIADVQ